MSSCKPVDSSKEDFRKYLDRKGVLDAITKVLIKCNLDRPENAIEYLLDNLGEKLKDKDTINRLENELRNAREEIETLKRDKFLRSSNAAKESIVDTTDDLVRETEQQEAALANIEHKKTTESFHKEDYATKTAEIVKTNQPVCADSESNVM
ncbi:c-Myc-binding protein-like [Malaya genurostris]|uniref:c-Myc-binding protein-like n=1 Tax=Malaya genurostris TaxID=325434 RepID=UPI0026F3B6B8|nr:c-Myc-binding protein-like [Malaya genurostris]